MKQDNTLLNLAALDLLSDGAVGSTMGVFWIIILFGSGLGLIWLFYYRLPKYLWERWSGPAGRAYYRALGLSPKTVERIKKREALRRKGSNK